MTAQETYHITVNGKALELQPGFLTNSEKASWVAKELAKILPNNMVEVIAEHCVFNSEVDGIHTQPPPMSWSPPSDLRFNQ